MNDTMVTVVGNVVDSPRLVRLQNGAVTNFRMASTARRYDTRTQQFVDASTFWVDVECWNDLSTHVSASIGKGDPVVVAGMLSTHQWDTDGGRRSRPQIKATAVGHNLARGISTFTKVKTVRPGATSAEETALPAPGSGERGLEEGVADHRGSEDAEELLLGRDYEPDDETLQSMTAGGRSPEPAHA